MGKLYREILFASFLFATLSASAQDIIHSRKGSYFTFIYRITGQEAKRLYSDDYPDVSRDYFHTLFDFFPTDSVYRKSLPVGHYLFVKTISDKSEFHLRSVNNISMRLLNNQRDLMMVFHDTLGNEIMKDVKVRIRNSRVSFRKSRNAFVIPKSNHRGIVSATYLGHTSFFAIDRSRNNTLIPRTGRKIVSTFPFNHIASPFFYVRQSVRSFPYISAPGIYHRTKRIFEDKPHSGYIAFNRPKYKPGDTIKLKAFIVTKKARPISKELSVELAGGYNSIRPKILGKAERYTKGGYTFDFILHDSLRLRLDQSYYLSLVTKKKRSLLSDYFRYEDYELKQNNFSARSVSRYSNEPATLYLKGTDSNDLPLYDARAEILIKPARILKYFDKEVFVADTLWFHTVKLDAIGETKVVLPDSIMPSIDFEYVAEISFLNADNERHPKTLSLHCNKNPFPLLFEISGDSLRIDFLPGLHQEGIVTIEAYDRDYNTLKEEIISLPYRAQVIPFAEGYDISIGKQSKDFELKDFPDEVNISASRTTDSLFAGAFNPRKLNLRWQLFRGNTLIEKGNGETIQIKRKGRAGATYSVSVQFIWAGESCERNYSIPLNRRNLDIRVHHPGTVYPGQSAAITIEVRDAKGHPVQNADITAYAITKKFDEKRTPTIPSFEKIKRGRIVFNSFREKELDTHYSRKLDWSYWRNILSLDSITFYQFLYPESGYFADYSPAEDSITQFAPFVVEEGRVKPVYIIYVNNEPVYYNQANGQNPYSFSINPGKHTVTLRTLNKEITLWNIEFQRGRKLIFSVDPGKTQSNVFVENKPPNLTDVEKKKLGRYFFQVHRMPGQEDAYIRQQQRVFLLKQNNQGREMIGPVNPGYFSYIARNTFSSTVEFEPFYSYEFRQGIIKMREAKIGNQLLLNYQNPSMAFRDQVMTEGKILKQWNAPERHRLSAFRKFTTEQTSGKHKGSLRLEEDYAHKDTTLAALFIVNLDYADAYSFYPGRMTSIDGIGQGRYQVVLFYTNDKYIRFDSLVIRPYGINYYNLKDFPVQLADTFSRSVMETISKWSTSSSYVEYTRETEAQRLRQLYFADSRNEKSFQNVVTGQLVDEAGQPIPGANVLIKGTNYGTTTDMDGYYKIHCPDNGVLVFSFIGYVPGEIRLQGSGNVDVKLTPDIQQLSEIVVVGYGLQTKHSLTASVASVSTNLMGRVAGISVNNIHVRGLSALSSDNPPLVIIDGVPKRLEDIDTSLITAMEVLSGDKATALYGARASGGVILISIKPGMTVDKLMESLPNVPIVLPIDGTLEGSSLRKNFRDYAFWKPSLRTDKNGKTTFEAPFPDDVTGWETRVLGMASKRRTGQAVTMIQSYKPLLAQLALPSFLLAGDTSYAIGKITNYTPDTLKILNELVIDGQQVFDRSLLLAKSIVDSLALTPQKADSVAIHYTIQYDAYRDGELRKIPVLPLGTSEARGIFAALTRDTTFTLHFDQSAEPVTLYAQSDMLDVLFDEVKYLRTYPYECNEQLASKLKGLLVEKKIMQYRNEAFTRDAEIHRIIKKLAKNQNKEGSWGWWDVSEGSIWMTLHVGKALEAARAEKYEVPYDRESMINQLVSSLAYTKGTDRLRCLIFLVDLGEKVNAKAEADTIFKQTKNNYSKLLSQELLSVSGLQPNWDWIESQRRETLKGNICYGEEKVDLFHNDVMNTLIVYRMKERNNPQDASLLKMRHFFLEKRKHHWRNTYESSLILETLLPSLIRNSSRNTKPVLTLSGGLNQRVEEFPFEIKMLPGENLTVAKEGSSPVYFTAYQRVWNAEPERVAKDFEINTYFDNGLRKVKAGKPVTLHVTVNVKKDAEYVMIQVPIPAGFSYESKNRGYGNGEVHREHYLHQTNIYCTTLRKGTYQYEIKLVPRFKGKYHLNPATVEWMYFPTVYGREEMKKMEVE